MKLFLIQFKDGTSTYLQAGSISLLNKILDRSIIKRIAELNTIQRSAL